MRRGLHSRFGVPIGSATRCPIGGHRNVTGVAARCPRGAGVGHGVRQGCGPYATRDTREQPWSTASRIDQSAGSASSYLSWGPRRKGEVMLDSLKTARWRAGAAAVFFAAVVTGMALSAAAANSAAGGYIVRTLFSDDANPAEHVDPHLVNGWGIAAGPTTPWWV